MRPKWLPDLYSGRPVTVFAEVRGELPSDVRLVAATTAGDEAFVRQLPLATAPERPELFGPRAVVGRGVATPAGPRRRGRR